MTTNNIKKLLEKINGKHFVSDIFHSLTNNKNLKIINTKKIPQLWTKIHFKTYPRFDKIDFKHIKIPKSRLRQIINTRRSSRQFTGISISKNELYHLLSSSSGLIDSGKPIDNSRRPYPSAGARYPLEVYLLIQNCNTIEKGLYHYNVKENVLELLLKEDLERWLIKATGREEWIRKAAVVFIITGVLDRTRIKYGDRGYRYSLLEAGHLGQNICLLATELGLGSCLIGGYIDDEVNKLLDISLQNEVALYLTAIGRI